MIDVFTAREETLDFPKCCIKLFNFYAIHIDEYARVSKNRMI